MLSGLMTKAKDLRNRAGAVDLTALTGKAKDAADAARGIVAERAKSLKARIDDSAGAYDEALTDFLELAATLPSIDEEDLTALVAGAKVLSEANPYR